MSRRKKSGRDAKKADTRKAKRKEARTAKKVSTLSAQQRFHADQREKRERQRTARLQKAEQRAAEGERPGDKKSQNAKKAPKPKPKKIPRWQQQLQQQQQAKNQPAAKKQNGAPAASNAPPSPSVPTVASAAPSISPTPQAAKASTAVAPAAPPVPVYIPPALRNRGRGLNESASKLQKALKSLFNKLSEGNCPLILSQVVALQSEGSSRREFFDGVCGAILEGVVEDVPLGVSILYPHAAVVRGLQLIMGNEFAASMLRETALRFQRHLESGERPQAYNSLFLVCTFFVFRVVEAQVVYGVLRRLVSGLTELHVELVLLLLRACGPRLRSNSTEALREVIAAVNAHQDAAEEAGSALGVRRRMIVGFINDLRTKNKAVKHASGQYNSDLWERLTRGIGELAHRARVLTSVSLDVTWDLLVQPDLRGQWWEAVELTESRVRRQALLHGPTEGPEETPVNAGLRFIRRRMDMDDDEPDSAAVGEGKGAEDAPLPRLDEDEDAPIVDDEDIASDLGSDPGSEDGEEAEHGEEGEEEEGSDEDEEREQDKAGKRAGKGPPQPKTVDLSTLAKTQHMTTPVKRAIFAAIAESVDIHECFVRLVKLDLRENSRDICSTIVQLCLQEKGYNPYYVALLRRLCSADRPKQMNYSMQCAIWVQFRVLDTAPLSLNRCLNLTHLIISLLTHGDITLRILKPMDLHQGLSKRTLMFLRVFLVHLLHLDPSVLLQHLMAVVEDKGLANVREGLATLMTKQLLVEDTVDEWLEPVMVTVDADRQLPLDRLAKITRTALKALQKT